MLDPKLLDQIIDVAAIAAYKSSLLKGVTISLFPSLFHLETILFIFLNLLML